ncbi:MAG: hypothetical protein ABMA02_18445 [Saprospiraceae bacterium]
MKNVLLLCLLLNALVAYGQTSSYWEELPTPPGGTPERITQTANGWVYAECYDHAVYYSQDNGLHWQQMFWPSNDPDTGFAKITVGRAGTLFAERQVGPNQGYLRYYDVYKSVDNGATWQHLLDSTNVHGLGETSTGHWFGLKDSIGGNFFVQLVVRSGNAGASWQSVNPLTGWSDYYEGVEIGGYDEVWVGRGFSDDRKYYSRDNGNTWMSKSLIYSANVTMLTFSNTLLYSSSYQICRFTPDGTTVCSKIDSTIANNYNYLLGFFQLPDSSLYATTSQFLYKSVDDGISWQRVGPKNGITFFYDDRPLFDGTWLASNAYNLARSSDLGDSWSFSAYGINRSLVQDIFLRNEQEWLAWTGNELWHTNNAGQDWELRFDNAGLATGLHLQSLISDDAANIWLTVRDSLLFSSDMGQTFQNITPPAGLSTSIPPKIGLNGQQNALFACTPGGTMRTPDNGLTWEPVLDSLYLRKTVLHPSGALFGIFDSIFWHSNQINFYFAPILYRSDNDGQTWQSVSDQIVEDLTITPDGDLFASSSFFILRSTDLGSSWISLQQNGQQIASDPGGFLFAFSSLNEEAYMSINDGHTWQGLPAPNVLENVTTWSISSLGFNNQSHLFIRSREYAGAGTKGRLFRTARPTQFGTFLNGTVFKDADGDCDTNDPESPLENWIVRADGNDSWWATTDSAGHYTMYLDTGTYFLTVKPALELLWQSCADSLPVSLSVVQDTVEQDVPVLAVADCPYMTVLVAAPWLERCFDSFVWVVCCNEGTEGTDSAWVDVTLDPALIFTDTTLNYEALGNNTFRFQLGAMPQGYCQNFMFRVYVDCDSTVLGQTTCISAHVYPDSLCVEPAEWSGAEISVSARCEQDTALRFDVTNTGPVPTQGLHYFVIEDDVVLMDDNEIYQPGQTRSFSLPANGHFCRFESEQEPGHPFSLQVAAWVEGCAGFQGMGFPNWYFLNNGIPSQDVYCGELVGSFDPNDKQGFPVGYGSDRLVPPNTDIEYLVRFQNTGTAPAHRVLVRDTLSNLLDPATLRMGPTSHPATWTLDGQGVLVVTFADINLPDSSANEAASHGFFSFTIAQKPDLPNGSIIHNTASIYFDFNSPIHTNKTRHQIGRGFIAVDVTEAPGFRSLRVFPNPVAESAVLTFEELRPGPYRFLLTDVSGKTVYETAFHGNALNFQRESLPGGLYFFQLLGDTGKRAGAGKVLLKP